jgi:hypothetical protein
MDAVWEISEAICRAVPSELVELALAAGSETLLYSRGLYFSRVLANLAKLHPVPQFHEGALDSQALHAVTGLDKETLAQLDALTIQDKSDRSGFTTVYGLVLGDALASKTVKLAEVTRRLSLNSAAGQENERIEDKDRKPKPGPQPEGPLAAKAEAIAKNADDAVKQEPKESDDDPKKLPILKQVKLASLYEVEVADDEGDETIKRNHNITTLRHDLLHLFSRTAGVHIAQKGLPESRLAAA